MNATGWHNQSFFHRLRQQDEHEKKLQEDIYEMTKPLARYKDDEDLDEMLKQQERAEDPMLAFMHKNKSKSKERKKGIFIIALNLLLTCL